MTSYRVTESTTDVHGVTDAQLAGEVARLQEPQAPARKQAPTINQRLDRLASSLRDVVEAHDRGLRTWQSAGAPLRSPNYDQRRGGKPHSQTPPEADGMIRTRLVLCAQRLAIALRILARHQWLVSDPWVPDSLQAKHVVVRDPLTGHALTEVPAFDEETGDPRWRDAEDVTVQPVDIAPAVSQLRGAVESLRGVEWETADEADRDTCRDVLHEAEEGVKAVANMRTPKVMPTESPKVCVRQGCWNDVASGQVCRACIQRDYRERKKGAA